MTSYQVTVDSVAWQVMDDEAVVINTDSKDYFSLNLSGTFLWQHLVERACGEQELVQGIATRYQLGEDDARAHVEAFLGKLKGASLVQEDADGAVTSEKTIDAPGTPSTDPYEPPDLVKFGDLEALILSGE